MHIDLRNRTAIVTGSTRGIGFATVRHLALSGAAVIVNGRERETVDQAVAAVQDAVPAAAVEGVAADLGTREGCDRLIEAVPRCDILVNNVGVFGPEDVFDVDDATWQRFLDVNVMSGVRLSRAYLPAMAERGWGRVVFVSSESALNIPSEMIHYGVTKTALLGLARGLAKRMAGTGVTVNSVLPGPTLSEGLVAMLQEKAAESGQSIEDAGRDFVRENRPSSILGRPATVDEVASLIVYTCSPQASATTGAALRVDGGVVDSIV